MLAWLLLLAFATPVPPELEKARDAQDRAALDRIAGQYTAAAQQKPKDADAQYRAAVAQSYVAEVAIEVRDNQKARDAAENGIKAAERAVALNGSSSEYHRILGTLCGQVIPAAKLRAGRSQQGAPTGFEGGDQLPQPRRWELLSAVGLRRRHRFGHQGFSESH
jgi:hypothetical protein